MKLHTTEHTYSHPWSAVTTAVWQKYPNERTPHVVTVDVLRRDVDQERKVLRTERLITLRQNIPAFIARFFGAPQPVCHFLEVSEIDLTTQTYTAISTNLTFRDLMVMDETVRYTADPSAPQLRTRFVQDAAVSASMSRFGSYLEDALIKRFKDNAHVGRQALADVIDRIVLEGKVGLQHLHIV
ncbi:PRELI-like family-domain-containing protein [Blastocladiella britannica]|nr:PRELI-like family-domain-containing protein [Blastocladiella britannica]